MNTINSKKENIGKRRNKALFIDRDGVINIDHGYISKIEDFKFIPGTIKALKRIPNDEFKLIIITNQSGIGRGYYSLEDYKNVEAHMLNLFAKDDIKINKVYFCPHDYDEECECRKPKTKFFNDAKKEFDIDLSKSFMIGDKTADIKAGQDAGCTSILVLTGKAGQDGFFNVKPDFIAKDLYNAIDLILEDKK
jgi:D-glycero-D-manno-heptose 1,7-bisphosphate phosphatase